MSPNLERRDIFYVLLRLSLYVVCWCSYLPPSYDVFLTHATRQGVDWSHCGSWQTYQGPMWTEQTRFWWILNLIFDDLEIIFHSFSFKVEQILDIFDFGEHKPEDDQINFNQFHSKVRCIRLHSCLLRTLNMCSPGPASIYITVWINLNKHVLFRRCSPSSTPAWMRRGQFMLAAAWRRGEKASATVAPLQTAAATWEREGQAWATSWRGGQASATPAVVIPLLLQTCSLHLLQFRYALPFSSLTSMSFKLACSM